MPVLGSIPHPLEGQQPCRGRALNPNQRLCLPAGFRLWMPVLSHPAALQRVIAFDRQWGDNGGWRETAIYQQHCMFWPWAHPRGPTCTRGLGLCTQWLADALQTRNALPFPVSRGLILSLRSPLPPSPAVSASNLCRS